MKEKIFTRNFKIIFISLIIIAISINEISSNKINTKIKTKLNLYLLFEYTYTCGTWYNRGKEVINEISSILEKNGLNVIPSIKPYHIGELPSGYNGEFNIFIVNNNNKILVATSEKGNNYFHEGLKSFAFTYFQTDPKTGERNYLAVNPQREDLLKYALQRVMELVKKNNLNEQKNYYVD